MNWNMLIFAVVFVLEAIVSCLEGGAMKITVSGDDLKTNCFIDRLEQKMLIGKKDYKNINDVIEEARCRCIKIENLLFSWEVPEREVEYREEPIKIDECNFHEYFIKEHNYQSEPKDGKYCDNCKKHTIELLAEEFEYIKDVPLHHPVKCLEASNHYKKIVKDERAAFFVEANGYCDLYQEEKQNA